MNIHTLPQAKVLVIDDDVDISTVLAAALETLGCVVTTENSALRAEQTCRQFQPDLVLIDLMMPGHSGLELIPLLHRIAKDAVICAMTGLSDPNTMQESMNRGASNVLLKPYSLEDLIQLVELSVLLTESVRQESEAGYIADTVQLEWPGDHVANAADLARLVTAAAATGLDRDTVFRKLPVVAAELLENAHDHGTRNNPDLRYGVQLSMKPESLCLEVWDQGKGFDGPTTLRRTQTSLPVGKLGGLQIVAAMSEKIEFKDNSRKVSVCLRINRSALLG
ncbi:response regulator [bacterium]|nr:response regulator [bacterium]